MSKRNYSIGFRGWMLVIYQAIAFLTFISFTNYPMNILADMYGGSQTVSTIYTVSTLLCIVIQLTLSTRIGKVKNIKLMGVIFGAISLVLALGIMLIPPANALLWQICYGLLVLFVVLYCTFSLGILVGQWFPRRKGTIMGIATLAFPIGNALISGFASSVFKKGYPDVAGAFLPFFIVALIGLLIGAIFVKDYPEQCGAYRDNDKSVTPEAAKAMMEAEIVNKKTSVWTLGNTLRTRDFWLITLPMGFLLMCAVGMMTQTASIIGPYAEDLAFIGGFGGVMITICIMGCFGSWLLGVLDTKFGTKTAITISVIIMIFSGVIGFVQNAICLLISLICLAIFMGASSNFTVSAAAQYWRREDFSNVFACVNPIANIVQAVGPMIIAILIATQGYTSAFLMTGILGVVSLIMISMFKPEHVKAVDDEYRTAAGKPLDEALVGRK